MDGLDDLLAPNLRILFIGYNPGLRSAELGHNFAGHSNQFWSLLYRSGLIPTKLTYLNDRDLPGLYGFGFTNIVPRPTRAAAELTKEEFLTGRVRLAQLIQTWRPHIACYLGIGVYKAFSGRTKIGLGLQKEQMIPGTQDYVAPSPSGLNRMSGEQKLEAFVHLRELLET